MPLKTTHYKLTAFQAGDRYRGDADKERMTIIDNEMAFVADQVGDGIIGGWSLTQHDGFSMRISAGSGLVSGVWTRTQGFQDFTINDNNRWRVYMNRRPGVIGWHGPHGLSQSVIFTDNSVPATPTGVAATTTYQSVSLSWDVIPAPNIAHYTVYRSGDGVSYFPVANPDGNAYVDTAVSPSVTYHYKISATNYTGTEGSGSAAVAVTTAADSTVPGNPSSLNVQPGSSFLQVFWLTANGNLDHYKITIQPIDSTGANDGSAIVETTPGDSIQITVTGLTNGQSYAITVQSVSPYGVLSSGVTATGTPSFSPGPDEITNLSLSDFQVDSSGNIGINAQWDQPGDAYNPLPAYYLVTVYPPSGDGSQPSIYTGTNISITAFTTTSDVIVPVREETTYFVRVQGVNAAGNTSRGVLGKIITKKFSPPPPVSSLAVTQTGPKVIIATWSNPSGKFSYNTITITQVNLITNTQTPIESGTNIGSQTSYAIPQQFVGNSTRFDITITAYDRYGNVSPPAFASYAVGAAVIYDAKPPAPAQQDSRGGDQQIIVTWSDPDTTSLLSPIVSYNIWRADYASKYAATDFAVVGNAPVGRHEFVDYNVENDKRYVYLVTSLTETSQSANPGDGFISYTLVTSRASNYSGLSSPVNITAVANGFNVNLAWDSSQDEFDGYQILRSDGDNSNYREVGTVSTDATSFVDDNALTKSGTFYYIVRKYTDEADVFATTSLISPVNSVLVGIIDISDGVATINQSHVSSGGPFNDILNLDDPIRLATRVALNKPHHLYVSDTDDRRIELSPTLTIDNWQTTDYTTYTTAVNVAYTGQYVVYINGQESTVLSQLDKASGTLVFQTAISDGTDPVPLVSVVFPGIPEVDGILPASQVGGLSARQITRGFVEPDRLPALNHDGRMGEVLLPKRLPMASSDGHKFTATSVTKVGTTTTFYDLTAAVGDPTNFIAATSSGVLASSHAGTEWDVVFSPPEPITKVFTSSGGIYFALGTSQVYRSTTSPTSWVAIDGFVGVKSVRDIIEAAGTIYASTDKGVYAYIPDEITKVQWSQTSLFDYESTNAYGLYYAGGLLFVGTDNGLYYSTNGGISWYNSPEFREQAPVLSSTESGIAVFILTKDRLWRRVDGEFEFSEVSLFTGTYARRVCAVNGRLFVSTNNGLLVSDPRADLLNDTTVKLVPAFQSLQRNGKMPAATSLNAIDGDLYIGTEQYLYAATASGKLKVIAEYPNTTIPTVYHNGQERQLGVFFSVANPSVWFDQKVSPTDTVEVVTDYSTFTAPDGGWADSNYRAQVNVRINSNLYAISSVVADYAAIGNMPLPSPDPRTADMTSAIAALANLVPYLNGFASRAIQQNQFNVNLVVTPDGISQLFAYVEAYRQTLYPSLQSQLNVPPIPAQFSLTFPTSVAADTLRVTVTCDVVSGDFTVTPGIDKYDAISIDILAVPITNTGDTTHWNIEDAVEKVNSGLPARIARVQQSNVLKMLLLNERQHPGQQALLATPYQSVYSTPCPAGKWYDKINSTVDYTLQYTSSPDGVDLPFAVDILLRDGGAWVGGDGGILSVNPATGDVFDVPFPTKNHVYVKGMFFDGTTVFVLTDNGLFTSVDGVTLTKDVDLEIPNNTNNLIYTRGNYVAATDDGVYTRRAYNPAWHKVLSINNAKIRPNGSFIVAFGSDPARSQDTLAYSSTDGAAWDNQTRLESLSAVSAVRAGSVVYYATPTGLYFQDTATLNSGEPVIGLVDVLGDAVASAALAFNDVSADTTRVVAAVQDGTYWINGSGTFAQGDSGFGVLHKSRLINGSVWLFGRGLVSVEGVSRTIRLSTGEALL